MKPGATIMPSASITRSNASLGCTASMEAMSSSSITRLDLYRGCPLPSTIEPFRIRVRIPSTLPENGPENSVVALNGSQQLIDLNVFIDGVRQVFARRSESDGPDSGLARIMAPIGAERVLRNLRIQPCAFQARQCCLHKFILRIEYPTGEESFSFNLPTGVALLHVAGEVYAGIEVGIVTVHIGDQREQRLQHRLLCFSYQ